MPRSPSKHPVPADVLVVIEVADTSANCDREVKIPVYARAGIPEAWLVDLPADRIETYRNPAGGSDTHVTTISRGATLPPLALPKRSWWAQNTPVLVGALSSVTAAVIASSLVR